MTDRSRTWVKIGKGLVAVGLAVFLFGLVTPAQEILTFKILMMILGASLAGLGALLVHLSRLTRRSLHA